MSMPLVFGTLFFAVFATVEWRRLPVIARVYLGVATAFALGALAYPGMTIAEAVEQTRDGLSVILEAARLAGFAAVMISVATALRNWALR
jgi:hypothetical protein